MFVQATTASNLLPQTRAYIAASGVAAPVAADQKAIDEFIRSGLLAPGTFAMLDWFHLYGVATRDLAKQNIIAPGTYTASEVSGPIGFLAYNGYQGDGSTQYLDLNFNPSTAGGKFTQDSMSLGIVSLTSQNINGYEIGNDRARIKIRDSSNTTSFANSTSSATASSSDGIGLFVITRSNSTSYSSWRNDVETPLSTTSATPSNAEIYVLKRDGGTPTARRIAAAFAGGALSDDQVEALYACLAQYFAVYSITI
jgi:hypothetical protein